MEEVVQGQTRTRLMEQAGFTTRGKDGLRQAVKAGEAAGAEPAR